MVLFACHKEDTKRLEDRRKVDVGLLYSDLHIDFFIVGDRPTSSFVETQLMEANMSLASS